MIRSRLARAAAIAVLAVGAGLVTSALPASAVGLWSFVGTVTDPFGTPIAGAVVGDGSQQATTDAQGHYVLAENTPSIYTLTAQAAHHAARTKRVSGGPTDTTVDFDLPYLIGGSLADPDISTAGGPASEALTITDWAPASGSCITVTDSRTDQASPAALSGTNPDGSSTWSWTLSAPQGSAEGDYSLTMSATRCSDGLAQTDPGTTYYTIDNTPPQVSQPTPTGSVSTQSITVGAVVTDTLSGPSPELSTFSVDGQVLAHPYSYDQASDVLSAPAGALGPGAHQVQLTASDWAGNTTTLSWSFTVDRSPPTFTNPSPTGSVATPTPLISVQAFDDTALAPSTATIEIAPYPLSGSSACALPASLDPATGEITYQVPSAPAGPCPGEAPLPPGTYVAEVSVADAAGNVASLTWSFTVSADPSLPAL
ncbi:MAG TPA: carboxypeptidase-like regulatory domain-containing protein [Candidatus Dormibacteraeota bacterium]|nr:carboxypeptidase-like regulatory domain-containing protein [Candidatus Dormibacteraeota bacterium]